jgi:hypothetical protein
LDVAIRDALKLANVDLSLESSRRFGHR